MLAVATLVGATAGCSPSRVGSKTFALGSASFEITGGGYGPGSLQQEIDDVAPRIIAFDDGTVLTYDASGNRTWFVHRSDPEEVRGWRASLLASGAATVGEHGLGEATPDIGWAASVFIDDGRTDVGGVGPRTDPAAGLRAAIGQVESALAERGETVPVGLVQHHVVYRLRHDDPAELRCFLVDESDVERWAAWIERISLGPEITATIGGRTIDDVGIASGPLWPLRRVAWFADTCAQEVSKEVGASGAGP